MLSPTAATNTTARINLIIPVLTQNSDKFLGISKICSDLMGIFFWRPETNTNTTHLIFEIPHTWVSCAGLGNAWGKDVEKAWICLVIMETQGATDTCPHHSHPSVSHIKELVKEASIMNEAHRICRFTRAKDHVLGSGRTREGSHGVTGLFHYSDVFLEARIKG